MLAQLLWSIIIRMRVYRFDTKNKINKNMLLSFNGFLYSQKYYSGKYYSYLLNREIKRCLLKDYTSQHLH